MSGTNGNNNPSLSTAAERRTRDKSDIDLDRQVLDDNVKAAIAAAERIHLLAKKKLVEQGLAPAASSGGGLGDLEIKALAKGLVTFLRTGFGPELMERLIEPELAARDVRIDALEAELAEKTSYCGIWREGNRYRRNEMATHGGNLWCCEVADTVDTPGTSDAWCLMQKTKGRQ